MSDRPPSDPRPYRLTPAGLAALRASAARHRPWLASTGPRTAGGKAAARMNALRHGERSVDVRRTLARVRDLLRAVREPSATLAAAGPFRAGAGRG